MMTQKLKAEKQMREEIVRTLLKMSSLSLLLVFFENMRSKIAVFSRFIVLFFLIVFYLQRTDKSFG